MTHLEVLAKELDMLAKQYTRRYQSVACKGNEVLTAYLEGRAAGLTQAMCLVRSKVMERAETDKEEAG